MMAIQRTRAERAMKRSSEAKQRNREFEKQKELEKQALVNKGSLDAQRLTNEGNMAMTQLKEEGDWGRHKSDIDWKTGDANRTFEQREGQFDRAFQQTQSIADRTADQWTTNFNENKRQFDANRFDKGITDMMSGNVDPVTGEVRPNAIGRDQAAQDVMWTQGLQGKSPDEIAAMRQGAGVQSFLKKWDTLDATGKKKQFGALSPDFVQALYATGNFHYGKPSQSSAATSESIVEKTKTAAPPRPLMGGTQTGRGSNATGLFGDQDDKGAWRTGKLMGWN